MKEEKQDQENYFALRLGRRHHPPMILQRPHYYKCNALDEKARAIKLLHALSNCVIITRNYHRSCNFW
jgi:hypothetical protein